MRRVVAFAVVMLLAVPAFAEEGPGAEVTAYLERIVEGHRLYRNNEHEAALRAYRAALEGRADDPLATFFVGCAQRATGDLDGALATFRRAVELAGDSDASLHAQALWNVAMVQEARRELGEAREAWRAYITYAEAHSRVTTFVANARQRLDAITGVEELEATYVPVRERIAADRSSSR